MPQKLKIFAVTKQRFVNVKNLRFLTTVENEAKEKCNAFFCARGNFISSATKTKGFCRRQNSLNFDSFRACKICDFAVQEIKFPSTPKIHRIFRKYKHAKNEVFCGYKIRDFVNIS
jgi:hypothetical protein